MRNYLLFGYVTVVGVTSKKDTGMEIGVRGNHEALMITHNRKLQSQY